MPSASALVIAALWTLSIWAALRGATEMSLSAYPQEMSSVLVATLLLMPVVFFGTMSFWMPHSPFYHPALARILDARFGAHAFESFLVRLKPLLMFAAAAAVQGLVGLWHDRASGAEGGAYAVHGFLLSGGVGFALVHVVLDFRKAVGVFPKWAIEQPVASAGYAKPERKRLRDALRAYWWTLLGVAILPLTLVGAELLHIPLEFFMLPFFGVFFLAGWPYLSGRAPYTFWLVACGVWLAGGIVAAILSQLLRAILA